MSKCICQNSNASKRYLIYDMSRIELKSILKLKSLFLNQISIRKCLKENRLKSKKHISLIKKIVILWVVVTVFMLVMSTFSHNNYIDIIDCYACEYNRSINIISNNKDISDIQYIDTKIQDIDTSVQCIDNKIEDTDMNMQDTSLTDTVATTTEQDALLITSPSAILIEATTGNIIYEKNPDEVRELASVTKIMTLILIFDAINNGQIQLDDEVVTSEHASSMGGSQVYLEAGEVQTVETLIKCIAVASANDGCVAMAEYISGSEEAFVNAMNERAKALGMTNTHFVNCCGLDATGHASTARDISLMSRELITKYPEIFNYCSIWQENIIHTTRRGSSEFGLTNTNKLIKQYEYATGLKTGYTSIAKYCISATARKNDMDIIAVIMGADDYRTRTSEAISLLNYGFANCSLFCDNDNKREKIENIHILNGIKDELVVGYKEDFNYVLVGKSPNMITSKIDLVSEANAPITSGDVLGKITYYLEDKEIGAVDIIALEDIKEITYTYYLRRFIKQFAL